ncbi:hypothetical protein [Solirubrobacter soli]|uniref:hypothetical protein n=1 Tax=Solirubrobacter soli TaxID=363832 RepID=UPI0004281D3F|nr:hypothetical protein [Solirubrobacter soli]
MDEIVGAQDRAALFRQGITIVDARREDGKLRLEVTGGDDERVIGEIRARFGADTQVAVRDAYPRQLCVTRCAGYMEREPKRLQLRWVLWPNETIADIVVVEDDESVVVLGLKSVSFERTDDDPCECPTHVYLEQPLGDRTVYDACGGDEIRYKNVYDEIKARMAGI